MSCRFLLGGEEGRLKYAPPANFSPLFESLLPTQNLRIDPGFYMGDLNKAVLSGPLDIDDKIAFVPKPVDTSTVGEMTKSASKTNYTPFLSQIQLQPMVENIRDKLAENIHEMWAVSKIENGWQFGERLDDEMMLHPCLTQFQTLPQAEKRYNIQLAIQTLRTIIALGYSISMDKPPSRIKSVRLPNEPFLQTNGYKPAPLDLSAIELNVKMEELVDQLAENTHNVWAKERISQGWTYGLNEDVEKRRSPHLVHYANVDEAIKVANRNTASETVRTLLVYGYVLDPPSGDKDEEGEAEEGEGSYRSRTYRLERTYGVSSGKWYYECEVLTEGSFKVGWQTVDTLPDHEVGGADTSWAFDGHFEEKLHMGMVETYGKRWHVGDIVGIFLDLVDHTISFSLNGELLVDPVAGDAAFSEVTGENFVPAFTLCTGQKCRLNFGHNVDSLRFFTMCGLQEGYEPFCVNMTRNVTFWYTKSLPIFENNEDLANSKIDVTRLPAGADNPPSLKISHNTYEQEEKADWEFLRLSLPVTLNDTFISEHEKARRWQHYQQSRNQPRQNPRNRSGHRRQPSSPAELTPPEAGPGGMDREALEMINEYFYSVRIFPGQDPNVVYVGWVTTQYHIHSMDFTQDMVRVVMIQQLDNYGRIAQSTNRQSCYMVRADELYAEVSKDPSGKTPSQVLCTRLF